MSIPFGNAVAQPGHAPNVKTFVVNDWHDGVDDNIGDGICHAAIGTCTLRAAIQEANVRTKSTRIELTAQPMDYLIAIGGADEDNAATGDLDILGTIYLVGDGTNVITGNDLDRVFDIFNDNVIIEGVTITDGYVIEFPGPPFFGSGGGIRVRETGVLTLKKSTVSNNFAAFSGGGIHVDGYLTTHNVTITGNDTDQWGGGLFISGTATLRKTVVQDNETNYVGAGIYNQGFAKLVRSTVANNDIVFNAFGSVGGGIYSTGTLKLFRSTIHENSAYNGGGIAINGGVFDAQNSTISGNTADADYGGLYLLSGASTLANVTIAENFFGGVYINSLATLRMRNTLIAQNVVSSGLAGAADDCVGTIISYNYNLIGDPTNCTLTNKTSKNIYNVTNVVLHLEDNGGGTLTHKLTTTSPAIDKGNKNGCVGLNGQVLTTDQRGHARAIDGDSNGTLRCDIGAYEYEPKHADKKEL